MRKVLKWSAVAAAVIGALLAALYALREPLISPRLARLLSQAAAERLGVEIAVGRVSGTYFSGLTLEQVRTLRPNPRGPVVSADVNRLSVRYAPLALAGGTRAFLRTVVVEIEGAALRLRPAAGEPPAADEPGVDLSQAAALLPAVRVRDSRLEIEAGGAWTRLEGITLTTAAEGGDGVRLALAVADWRWRHPQLAERGVPVTLSATLEGPRLAVERLALGKGEITATAEADIGRAPAAVPFRAELRIFEGSLSLAGAWEKTGLRLETAARGLEPARLAAFAGLSAGGFGGRLDWDAEARIDPARPAAGTARLSLSADEALVFGTNLERADLEAALEGGTLAVAELGVRSGRNQVRLTGFSAPAADVFAGRLAALAARAGGGFALSAGDVPALLALFGLRPPRDRDLPPHALSLRGRLAEGRLLIDQGRLETEDGELKLSPTVLEMPPAGRPWSQAAVEGGLRADIRRLGPVAALFGVAGARGSLSVELTAVGPLSAPGGRGVVRGENLAWDRFAADRLRLEADADRRRVNVGALELRRGPDRVTGTGTWRIEDGRLEKVRLSLELADISPYLGWLAPAGGRPAPAWTQLGGALSGGVSLSGPAADPDGTAELALEGLRFQGRAFGRGRLSAAKQGRTITVARLGLENGADRLSAAGAVDLAAGAVKGLTLSAEIAEMGRYTEGLLPPAWAVSGAAVLKAAADGALAAPQASVQAGFERLRLGGRDIGRASLAAEGDGRRVRVESLEVDGAAGRLSLAALVEHDPDTGAGTVRLERCRIGFRDLALALAAPARLAYDGGGMFTVDRLALAGPTGQVTVAGRIAAGGRSDLEAQVAGLAGGRWFAALAGEAVDFQGLSADLRLSGAPERPQLTAAGSAAKVRVKDFPDPLAADFEAAYTAGGLSVRRLEVRGAAGTRVSLTAELPLRLAPALALPPGPIAAAGRFSIPDVTIANPFLTGVRFTSGAIEGDFRIGGSWRAPQGRLAARGREIDLDAPWQPRPPGPYGLDVQLALEGGRLELAALEVTSPALTLTGAGDWQGLPAPAELLRAPARRPTGTLDFTGRLEVPDLGWLARAGEGLRRTGGRLAADFRLDGPAAGPRIEAGFRVTGGELQPAGAVPPLQEIDLRGRTDSAGLTIEKLTAKLGGAPLEAAGEWRWAGPGGGAVALRLKGQNLLLYRDEGLLIRADTDLAAAGPPEALSVTGTLAVTKGLVRRNLNLLGALRRPGGPKTAGAGLRLFSFENPPLRDMRFDVQLTAAAAIEIEGNLAQGAVRPDLHLGGTGELPVLTGKMYVDPTRVSLPSGRLKIEAGVVRFLETDPDVPVLELNGGARMLGYDISVLVEGPYHQPEITLSSVPPLPADDLLMLLLTGRPPKSGLGGRTSSRQNVQVALYVGRDLLANWFSGDSPEQLEDVLDRFDFEIGRDVTRSGDETIEASFRLADGLLLERDQLLITGEKDAYDDFNAGVRFVFRFK